MIYLNEIERKFRTIVPESVDNANEQLKNVITIKEDKFTQELIVKTETFRMKGIVNNFAGKSFLGKEYLCFPAEKHMIELQYKSSPSGEEFSIFPLWERVNKLNININGNTNISLGKYAYTEEYFSISKADFIKCCEAKTLYIQLREDDNICYEDESSREDIILYFQTLYNEVIDGAKYQDSKEKLVNISQKTLVAYVNEYEKWLDGVKEEEKREKRRDTILKLIGILLIVIGVIMFVIALNSMFDGKGGLVSMFIALLLASGGVIMLLKGTGNLGD